jgi:hypothetical protein
MYTPLVFNDDYGDYWTTTTTLTSPFVNPYFVSTMNTPIRTHVSSLGTAVNTTVVKALDVPVLSPIYSPTLSLSLESDDLEVSVPIAPVLTNNVVEYENLNNDPDLIRKVTKYFFEKTMNSWLYSDFEDLLTYLVIKGDKVSVVSNKKELENNKRDSNMKSIEKKVNFIADNVMTKYDMKSFLKKYALKSGLDLWKLKENKSYVKKSIYKKIKNKLEKLAYHR